MGNASILNGWRQLTLLSMTFTAMLVTAKIFSKSEAKNERQGKTQISSGSGPACVTSLGVHLEPKKSPVKKAVEPE